MKSQVLIGTGGIEHRKAFMDVIHRPQYHLESLYLKGLRFKCLSLASTFRKIICYETLRVKSLCLEILYGESP
jgi:hypothetical protein